MKLLKQLLVSILIAISTFNGVAFAAFFPGGLGTPSTWSIKNGELYTVPNNATINVGACNGCGGGQSSVLTDGTTIVGDGLNIPLSAVSNPDNKILTGNAAWSGIGYIYDVSDLTFYFDGYYTASATQVTLAASDPSNDRFDAIVVDQAGTVSTITGTASSNPVFPAIPDTQLLVQYVYVASGSTTPVILQDLIYNENTGSPTEWDTSTYTTGTGATGSANFDSTNACKNGTKCADITSNARFGVRFTRTTSIDLQQFAYVQVWYRNNGSALLSTKTPTIRFDNSAGTPVGNTVSLITYGVSRTDIGTWQLAVIPVSAFGSVTQVKGLRAIVTGGTLAQQANWSLDFMLLSGGILPNGAIGPIFLSPSGTLYSSGAATGATAVTDSIFYGTLSGFGATAAYYSIFQGYGSGYSAVSADNSIFIGNKAGFKATNANNSIFQGHWAGYGAVNADNSQFLGTRSGFGASSAYSSSFMGANSGDGALNSYQSVFIGRDAGNGATNASDSFFLGYSAGLNASAASTSAFLGSEAGSGATNAAGSIFVGYQAGKSAVDSIGSIFIGQQAGISAANTAPSIAIGTLATPGAFNNSIALGTAATSTADNQMTIGSGAFPINQIVVSGTGGIQVPVGTTAERSASQGMIRYNTTTSKFEGYNGTIWVDLN